jgi:uncharacterized membrane protein
MPDAAAFCPGCGRVMQAAVRTQNTVGVLPENLAGALAYFLLPAIVFLFLEPYTMNRFVRFHSVQSLAVCLAGVAVGATLRLAAFFLFLIPVFGQLLVWLATLVLSLAWFTLWIVLVVKALQGEMFKLPVLGDFAEKQAG